MDGDQPVHTLLKSNGLPFVRRVHRPLAATCPLHLRRVCGVCPHFDGELRGPGRCREFGFSANGWRDARDCGLWERRSS
jgi:hypothetical protein